MLVEEKAYLSEARELITTDSVLSKIDTALWL